MASFPSLTEISGLRSRFLEVTNPDGLRVVLRDMPRLKSLVTESERSIPYLLLVSGTSESGKSFFGQSFVESNTGHRLKIYKTIAEALEKGELKSIDFEDPTNPFKYASAAQGDEIVQKETLAYIADEYSRILTTTDVGIAVVETFKHPWLTEGMKRSDRFRSIGIFVDAPEELRIQREALKKRQSAEIIKELVVEKDLTKASYGSLELPGKSDILVWNAGSIESYEGFIFLLQQLLLSSGTAHHGKAIDYS